MAIVKSTDPDTILKSAGKATEAFLIHGNDAGQVADVAKQLSNLISTRSDPPGDIIRLTEQDLSQTPGRLASEARNLPMFGGPPVIVIKQAPQVTPAMLQELLDDGGLAATIIIEAGNLKKDAKLRQIFEKARNAAAVACYGADTRSLQHFIRDEVRRADLTITPDALSRLTELLGADWSIARSEIEKLILYALGEKEITLEHVDAIVGDASGQAFDVAIAETLSGNAYAALRQLDRLAASATPASVVLILLLGYLQKLHFVIAGIDRGESFESAVAKLRPPVHFRQKDAMKAQIAGWRLAHISAMIERTQETIRQTRIKPGLEHELVSDFILRISDWRKRAA